MKLRDIAVPSQDENRSERVREDTLRKWLLSRDLKDKERAKRRFGEKSQ